MTDAASREAAATRALEQAGLSAAVRAAGPDGEIASLALPAERLPEVAAHAAAIRALGFRYVALDIGAAAQPGAGSG